MGKQHPIIISSGSNPDTDEGFIDEIVVRRDEEMDGEWEAPQIPNPACETAPGCGKWKRPMINNPEYKGKWKAPLVDNPNYQVGHSETFYQNALKCLPIPDPKHSLWSHQGVWKPRKISNPDYFEDLHPFRMTAFRALGLELWSMTSDIYFDNFIITSQKEVADRWASDSWGLKKLVASANEVSIVFQHMLSVSLRECDFTDGCLTLMGVSHCSCSVFP